MSGRRETEAGRGYDSGLLGGMWEKTRSSMPMPYIDFGTCTHACTRHTSHMQHRQLKVRLSHRTPRNPWELKDKDAPTLTMSSFGGPFFFFLLSPLSLASWSQTPAQRYSPMMLLSSTVKGDNPCTALHDMVSPGSVIGSLICNATLERGCQQHNPGFRLSILAVAIGLWK